MSPSSEPTQVEEPGRNECVSELPEVRLLVSLRAHEARMRKRLALCDDLCNALIALYRAAKATTDSGLGLNETDVNAYVRKAPASVHTICAMVRDFFEAVNRTLVVVELEASGESGDRGASEGALASMVEQALLKAIDEHTSLRSWEDVSWLEVSCDRHRHLAFQWAAAVDCLQKNPKRGYAALRPVVLLAKRVADESVTLFDPLGGPIAEERAAAYGITKKLRAQIEHIRVMVTRKCDALEMELRTVQTAIVKAQSQTMSLVKNLANMGRGTPPGNQ